jgi:hypothetical protein
MARPDIHRQIVEDRPAILDEAEISDLEKIHLFTTLSNAPYLVEKSYQ